MLSYYSGKIEQWKGRHIRKADNQSNPIAKEQKREPTRKQEPKQRPRDRDILVLASPGSVVKKNSEWDTF